MHSADIKTMTDDQLIKSTEKYVQAEREIVECLIWHLQEIQDRRLYMQMGYTSLFECLTKYFKYAETTAYARISALKILSSVPTAAQSLASGEVNLTTLTLTQSFIRKQEKETGEKVSAEQKIQFVEAIKNKTTEEVKQFFASINPVQELPLDKIQYLDKNHAQLIATIDKALLEKVARLKDLISHEILNPNFNELLTLALDAAIEKVEKKKGLLGTTKEADRFPVDSSTQSFAVRNSRYISRDVKRIVMQRSQGRCEHVHADGNRCSSRFQLQFDHVIAFSKGGSSQLSNIQNLCRIHNAHKGTT